MTYERQSRTLPLVCPRTGLTVGAITIEKIAGHAPFLKEWEHSMVLHPLFSLTPIALLQFSKNTWLNFCSLTDQEVANKQLTDRQEHILQVCALAMLHQLTDVDQRIAWMPSLADISSSWTQLLQLSYWKNYLESKRFNFPSLRINKLNGGISLHSFLQDCWAVKKDYESKVRESVELEKIKSRELASKVLRDELAGKAPRSKKLLWRWFLANMPSRYDRDTNGWMWELFDAETSEEVAEFTIADIDLFEEIVLSELELGSTISHTFLERLDKKRDMLAAARDYEILVPQAIIDGKADGSISAVEPQRADFAKLGLYFVAHAKWKLAFKSSADSKAVQAAIDRQSKVTVKASHRPAFKLYQDSETVADDDSPVASAPEGSTEHLRSLFDSKNDDDNITGEIEE